MTTRIGITFEHPKVLERLQERGLTPLFLSSELLEVRNLLDIVDGVVVPGNPYDVPPHLYGAKAKCETVLSPCEKRLNLELNVILTALAHDVPLLAICGGTQLLNVALGGTLHQHVPNEIGENINHRQAKDTFHLTAHNVQITAGTKLHSLTSHTEIATNTDHHQAIETLGESLIVNARCEDGVIEGIEHPHKAFCIGVQWHPEYVAHPIDSLIFDHFAEAAHAFRLSCSCRMPLHDPA